MSLTSKGGLTLAEGSNPFSYDSLIHYSMPVLSRRFLCHWFANPSGYGFFVLLGQRGTISITAKTGR